MGRLLVFHSKTCFVQISSISHRCEVQSVVAHLESTLDSYNFMAHNQNPCREYHSSTF